MRHKMGIILTAMMFAAQPVLAVTVVNFSSQGLSGPSQVMLQGQMARLDMAQGETYMLVDAKLSTVYMIDPAKKSIVEFNTGQTMSGSAQKNKVKLRFERLQPGPAIAGFPTQAYHYFADGQHCGQVFASNEAMNVEGLPDVLNAMKLLATSQRAAMGSYARFVDACKRASMLLPEHTERIGVPMQIVGREGNIISAVTRIDNRAVVAGEHFHVPAAYEKVSMFRALSRSKGF